MKAGQLGYLFWARAIFAMLIVVFGFGLVISLIKWLLAIRTRRKIQMSVGFLPQENR